MGAQFKRVSSASPPVWPLLFLTLQSTFLILCANGCKPAAKRTEQRPRQEAASRHLEVFPVFLRAIERAGGQDVWVKKSISRRDHPQGIAFAEIVVAARAQAAVLEAVRHEAQARKLRVRLHPGSNASVKTVQDAVIRGGKPLCVFRLVEVPRLLQAAIIIDDMGQNLAAARQLALLDYPLTFSIMPRVPYARQTALMVHRTGHEVMLHLPMQPLQSSYARVSPHQISTGMSRSEVENTVREDLDGIPFVAGVNNHMGSRATTDPKLMEAVMTVLASRHLFFIDSRTTAASVALDVARRMGVPAFYRSVFLDDRQNVDATLRQLLEFCAVVKRQGAAIAIGHPYPTTLAALSRFLPEFDRQEIELVPASRLARAPQFARLSPARPSTRR
jgi:polysaccharide deacetylase 2 family uncharacterized protein YibQ